MAAAKTYRSIKTKYCAISWK